MEGVSDLDMFLFHVLILSEPLNIRASTRQKLKDSTAISVNSVLNCREYPLKQQNKKLRTFSREVIPGTPN